MEIARPKTQTEKVHSILRDIVEESKECGNYVVVAQPRRSFEEKPAQNLDGYMGLHIDFSGYSHGFCSCEKLLVDMARNYLIDTVLETDAKYLFFVGEDTVIPWNGFRKLHETVEKNPNAMAVGVYYVKLSVPMIMIRDELNHIRPADVTPGQVFEAWQTGLDAALIPVKLLREMRDADPEIPFCCIAGPQQGYPFIGEDNFFVHRWRKAGHKLLVDTDVQCLHMDIETGKYTAHPDIDLDNYFTQIPITERLTIKDKRLLDKRYIERMPEAPKYEET
jgi:hypothetical protein